MNLLLILIQKLTELLFYEIPVPSLCKTEEKNYKIRLQDWLNLKIIRAESDYSIAELIKLIADKKGGAHYDEAMKKRMQI